MPVVIQKLSFIIKQRRLELNGFEDAGENISDVGEMLDELHTIVKMEAHQEQASLSFFHKNLTSSTCAQGTSIMVKYSFQYIDIS